MRPEEDPGWQSYRTTILEFQIATRPRVDLSQSLGVRELAIFQSADLPGPFGLVTPENPRGQRSTAAENDKLWREFRLGDLTRAVQVDGVSVDGVHRERGVALAWSRDQVVDLARTWLQSAIYWYDGSLIWLIGALSETPPIRLGANR